MKKLFASVAVAAMLALFALPAFADSGSAPQCASPPPPGVAPAQTYTCTMHLTNQVLPPMTVTPISCPDGSMVPGGVLGLTVNNGVFHVTINTAGDVWDTGTLEGSFLFVSAAGVAYTGHFTQWFGDSLNSRNFVSHATLNFVGSSSTGATLSLHLEFHFGVSASGQPQFFMQTHC